jgi:uncharacterized protein (DUF1330 family)
MTAKGYWIPHVDVHDTEGYKHYMTAAAEAHRKFDTRLLVRAGKCEAVEGALRSRNVLREFNDYSSAVACYRSPEYQRARSLRFEHAVADFVIVEGYDGPQPDVSAAAPAAAARKGYWIGHVDVTDPEGYKAYMAADMVPFGNYGGRFLVRGGAREVVEGRLRARSVVLEFPSSEAALACYRSDAYRAAAALRRGKAEVDLVIIEGCDGARPE